MEITKQEVVEEKQETTIPAKKEEEDQSNENVSISNKTESDDSIKIIEPAPEKKPVVVEQQPTMLSLSSSCNNSQAIDIKAKLEIGGKNDEFSFNDGCVMEPKKGSPRKSQQTLQSNKKSESSVLEVREQEIEIISESPSDKDMKKHVGG